MYNEGQELAGDIAMTDMILKGIVQEDGSVVVEDKVSLPPGEVELIVRRRRTGSISLEEAKRRMSEPEPELTPEQLAEYHRLHRELAEAAEDLGLPEDYADEIDHYLYGTPKRSVED